MSTRRRTYSQLGQDAWVASLPKPPGRRQFFVDVGAADGLRLSNSALLERQLGWDGLCIEPGPDFVRLKQSRRCRVDESCVHAESGREVDFVIDHKDPHFSGIRDERGRHSHRAGDVFTRTTKTLAAVLDAHSVPSHIDYLSVDTEGSEFEILRVFPFDRYQIGAITVEHNFEQPKRELIHDLLAARGFVRVRRVRFDDWYLSRNVHGTRVILKHLALGLVRGALRPVKGFAVSKQRTLASWLRQGVRRVLPFHLGNVRLRDVLRRCPVRTAVHVGAHVGQEAATYEQAGVQHVVWIEADPGLFERLQQTAVKYGHTAINALVADVGGKKVPFHRASNDGKSSSILPFGSAMESLFPNLGLVQELELETTTLAELSDSGRLGTDRIDLLVLDVQGAELQVLEGTGRHIDHVELALVEFSTAPLYEGGAMLADLDAFFHAHGMRRFPIWRRRSHGNALYFRP